MQLKDTLYTARMAVRDYQKSDLPVLTAMWFDGENGKYLSDPAAAYVDEKYQKALDGLEDNPNGYYLTLVRRGSEEILGSCFIFPGEEKGAFEIAYCIHKDHWGQGYGTELIPRIVGWIRDRGGPKITAEAAKENKASNALLRKSGFEVIGEGRFKKYNMDISFDSYIYRLIVSGGK